MDRTLILDCKNKIGEKVKICGWVWTRRDHGKILFLDVLDRSGLIQVVGANVSHPPGGQDVVSIIGKVQKRPENLINQNIPTGEIEIQAENIEILSKAQELPFDITGEEPNLDTRLEWWFLDLRRPQNRLIFEIQTSVEAAMRDFWLSKDFIEIHSPKLMGSPSESGAELFKLDYFGRPAYLAQSPQFYKQMAMAAGFERVFEIGPVFRANPSFTSRHDTEFTSVDMEMSYIDSHEDVMAFEEKWLEHILKIIKDKFGDEIKKTFDVDVKIPDLPFPRISMKEAVEIIKNEGYKIPSGSKGDLDPEAERVLAKYVAKKFGHEFVFVTDYPVSVRPFYHMRYDEDKTITKSFDLLWKGLEITTGAQREHRLEELKKQALEKGLHLEPIQFYLDFFKFGMPPHGGFGFGLTRLLMLMLGLKNVREVTYLYRGPNRLSP